MLIAKNIHKSYEDLEVLRGVDLEINSPSITCIVGKSGTGKSTLLHILGTLDVPDKGQVIINDMDVFRLSSKKLAAFRNQHIGFVFQFHHLIPEFTALENVAIPSLIKKHSKKESMIKAEELLDYMGLKNRLTHKPSELSGGEQQRVAVARALINSPSLVFADEPSGNLDTQTSFELHSLLKRLKEDKGFTFIIVTHNLELAAMADARLEMKDGVLTTMT